MFGVVVSLITSFGFLCLIRYIVFYRSETVKKLSKLSLYNVGDFVKKYRNKNIDVQFKKPPEKKNAEKQGNIENQTLPLSPVIGDNILVGANVFHQYMCIDDHMYEGISRMSGEHIDNFSDLSAKLGDYAHDSNGLTEGTLNKVKGHIAESHVAEHFEEAGIKVDWPETSNQESWDLLLMTNPIQVKLVKDANSLSEHFREHSYIPVVIPSDADNIPETAFHFDPSDGFSDLSDYLKENPENAVIVDDNLSHVGITESVEEGTDLATGAIDVNFPFITAAFSIGKQIKLLRKNDTDVLSATKNAGLDVGGVGVGGSVGAAIGSIFPGPGTVVGGVVGSFLGRSGTNYIKKGPLKETLKEFEEQREILQQETLKVEKKYEHLFNEDKKREQDNLDQMNFETKNRINEETKNLRLWIVEKEKSSEKSKTHFLENISDEIIFMRDQLELSWTDYFWPGKQIIAHQRKLNTIVRFRSQFINKNFKDRGFLLQWLAEKGLCREVVFSEIAKVEEERKDRENHLIENIRKEQKKLLDQRFKSVKELSDKFKKYIEQIRLDLSPNTVRIKKCQNRVKKESRKLGKKAA